MFDKNFYIILGVILLSHYILNFIFKIDNFANVNHKSDSIIWNHKEKELSPDEINKLKKIEKNVEEEDYSNWHNENRNNYNSAHLDINTNESEYTKYREKDKFADTEYY